MTRQTDTAKHGLMLAVAMLLCIAATASTAPMGEEQREWVCKAEGVYVRCEKTRSWVPCQEFRTRGMGIAGDRLQAVIEAESACADNMIDLMDSDGKNGRSTMKLPCSAVACELR